MTSNQAPVQARSYKNLLAYTTALAGAAAMAAVFTPTVSYAQDDDETIIVTGSRIARRDFVANSPVTTVPEEELQLSGVMSVESLLNELPQVVPGLSGTSNNPGLNGQATVDLRGLGPSRTLVLINGRRLAPSDKDGTVDINLLPVGLIERVEVVTGGTSAVYGSDAMAGVVNFILDDSFEGLEVGAIGGISDRDDGSEYSFDVTAGGNFDNDRGNATMFASYYNREAMLQSEREYSRVAFPIFWSSRIPSGSLERSILNPFPGNPSRLKISEDGDDIDNTLPNYDFAPPNMLILPADRVVLGGFANYDITDSLEAYVQTVFADSRTAVQLAAAPLAASTRVTVPAAVALAQLPGPAAQAAILGRPDPTAPITVQRRLLEVGPRMQSFDKKFYQTTLGLRGDLVGSWTWDAYYSFSRSDMYDSLTNDLSKSRLQAGLNACPAGSDPGCTPIDIFGVGSITTDQADWLRLTNAVDHHEYEQEVLSGNVTGDLFELPAGALSVAFGAEYRSDDLNFEPGPPSTGDLVGFNGVQAAGGSVTVREVYGEAVVPLLAGIPGINYLGLELGGRLSNYSSVGDVDTYKIGGEWGITEDLRFRAMYNKATRAPTVFQLFRAGDQNFPPYTDPCNNDTGPGGGNPALSGQTVAPGDPGYVFCAQWIGLDPLDPATEATLGAFWQSDSQVEEFRFGNQDLTEEESETITAGVVYSSDTPIGDISLALDYYDIDATNFISFPTANVRIGRCVAALDLNSEACMNAPRLSTGQLGGIRNAIENNPTGGVATSGVDLAAGYSVDIVGGNLAVNALISYLDKFDFAGGRNNGHYAGLHVGLGGAFPEYKTNIRTTYSWNDWQFSWQWEHIDGMDDYGLTALYPAYYPALDPIDYHDFTVRWFATDEVELMAVCENCLDEQPQFFTVSGTVAGPNIDASTYDPLGRYFRFGARLRF